MADEYVVYVESPQGEPSAEARGRLAELLGLDIPKLDALLRRLPAAVTKPVPEGTAVAVARRFREAGMEASLRAHDADELAADGATKPLSQSDGYNEATPIPEPSGSYGPGYGAAYGASEDAAGAADDEPSESWKTQFGTRETVEDEEEADELFPPAAFAQPQGPKAPSRPLLIAFLVVLAVLAALWFLF
ncbi:MAG: hypothetical protein WD273_15065 [Trueperaceae bacterium]